MSEITREEITALVESNTKVSTALQLISDKLENLSTLTKKILEDGEIWDDQQETIKTSGKLITKISSDIDKVKWFVGIIGISVIIVTGIIRGLDNRMIIEKQSDDMSIMSQYIIRQIKTQFELENQTPQNLKYKKESKYETR